MSCRYNIECADQVGVILVAPLHTRKPGLCLAIVCRHMPAGRTGLTRMVRRDRDEMPTGPRQFVVQLPTEFAPSLVEDRRIQTGLGPHVPARCFDRACRGRGHIPHLQVLETHDRVVFADRGRSLVQKIPASIADTGMDLLDAGFRLLPVVTEFHFTAHGALRLRQRLLMAREAVERYDECPVAEGREASNAHVDADDGRRRMHRLFDRALSLDRHEPCAI